MEDGAAEPDTSVFEAPKYVARQWTTEDGLPQNSVWSIEQTPDGALWVGTLGGLARFDGQTFASFSAASTKGLVGNRVRALHQDARGTLWIGAENGLSIRRNGTFRQVEGPSHVTNIDEGPNGTVWVGGRLGLYRTTMHPDGDSGAPAVQPVPLPDTLDAQGHPNVKDVSVVSDDSVWVAVEGDLFVYRNGDVQRKTVLPERSSGIRFVHAGPQGRLWVGTTKQFISIDGGAVTRYPSIDEEVRTMVFGSSGTPWVTTIGDGLLRIEDGKARPLRLDTPLPGRLAGLERDESGQWWVGSNYQKGLIRLRPRLFRTVGPPVRGTVMHAVKATEKDTVWAGTRKGGVFQISSSGITRYTKREGLASNSVSAIGQDRAGRVWAGSAGGVARKASGRFEEVRPERGGSLRGVRAMHRDAEGTLWMANGKDGLFRYRDGSLNRVLAGTRYGSSRILALMEDAEGTLWLGGRKNGVGRYRDGSITWYGTDDGVPYSVVRDVHETGDGTIWISTYGGGIARFEPEQERFTPVTTKNGLPAGTIHTIHEAPEGIFWMTSNEGVFRVPRAQVEAVADGRRDRLYVQSFGTADGMPARECNGNFQPAIAEDPSGRLWIPTMDGLAVVDAGDPRLDVPDAIPLRIAGVRVDGRPRDADSLRLQPSSNRLAVEFAATSLRYAEDLAFRYRLDGGAWEPARGRQTAEFTNLDAGEHRLEVQATLNGETWYALDAPLRVQVAPHFWETGWFRLLVGLSIFLAGGVAYWWRVRSLRRREEKLRRLVDQRTERLAREKRKTEQQAERLEAIDREKNRFFANVSHELRTPLTVLLGSIQDVLDGEFGEVPAPIRKQAEIMESNTRRLHRLTEQLLDLAHLETADPDLDPEPGDLVCALRRITRSFVPLAERRGVTLQVQPAVDAHRCRFDGAKMEKIAGNLISNAVENTPDGGSVTVRLDVEDNDGEVEGPAEDGSEQDAPPVCVIRVEDTGRGIPPERQEEIFERFAHGRDASGDREGTGIGLALARELTELHGGTIGVDSTPGEGSTFTVRLPLPTAPADVEPVSRGDGEPERRGDGEPRRRGDGEPVLREAEPAAGAACEAEMGERERPVLLVVEDNADVRAYLRRHLAGDYQMVEAEHGRDGLETAREVEPDLILADLMMPEMDGVELCRRVRDDEDLACTPFVMLTARAAENDAVTGLEAGADAYVSKPFSMDVLRARLDRIREAHWTSDAGEAERSFAPTIEADSADEQFLRRVTDAVDAHLSRADLTVKDLAAEVGLSPRQLQRRIKDATGRTAARFIRRYRLDVAAQLLETDAGTVREIAYRVGFGTPKTFRKHFRNRFGCPPSEF